MPVNRNKVPTLAQASETDEEYARTLDGHKIHLRSANGKFLVAEDHGAANANRKKAGSWETFTLSYEGGKKVGFKGAHDKYLVAEANGDANANRPVLAGWESTGEGPRAARRVPPDPDCSARGAD